MIESVWFHGETLLLKDDVRKKRVTAFERVAQEPRVNRLVIEKINAKKTGLHRNINIRKRDTVTSRPPWNYHFRDKHKDLF